MALGFRSVGARTKADISVSGSPQSFTLPLGHVSTDWLLWVIVTDDNTGPASTPSGWSVLANYAVGPSTSSPYAVRPHVWMFHRIDPGGLGTSVSCTFNTGAWPNGDGYCLGFIAAYTGADQSAPVEVVQGGTTTSTGAAYAHPQVTTVAPNDWLLSVRSADSETGGLTFTDSVGTDVERVDDLMTQSPTPYLSLYDSNTALTAGLQTQRTTTASGSVTYGSVGISIALKPANAANAVTALPGTASGTGTAFGANVTVSNGSWALCSPGGIPVYSFEIDWNNDGTFSASSDMLMLSLMGTGGVDDATSDIISDITVTYGRDQDRQLSPGAVGSAAMTLCNASRKYSPDNINSPLFGELNPAREANFEINWAGTTFPMFRGRVDDFDVHADFEDRRVGFTFLDGMALLQGTKISTGVLEVMRTGSLVNAILDEIGWTAGRDIDTGATVVKYWWAEGTDGMSAINDLVKSEGPPSVAYVAPDGTFVFRDRHHRILRTASVTSQGTFSAKALGDCTAVQPEGFDIGKPFTYAHGWRDIVNSVSFDIPERSKSASLEEVWTSDDTITLSIGQGITINITGNDPFTEAVTPVAGTDFTVAGAGTVNVTLSRTSGASVKITLLAVGGSVTIAGLRLRAKPIAVARTLKVEKSDTASIDSYGERSYPETVPWANANDAEAVANMVLLHYSQRRPTVQLRVVTSDPSHFLQVIQRTISDRIHITNNEMGIDDDFFVEKVTHTVQRSNQAGHPPVHSVILGCERDLEVVANPFTFDKRGAGFDDGVFDPLGADNPETVFIFDDPDQGQFDAGHFGT